MAQATYHPENQSSRTCARCRRPLVDPASLNEGVGPVCRKLDNRLLACLIPANFEAAMAAYKSIEPAELNPGTAEVFASLEGSLRSKQARGGKDWREEAKRVEWVLSFQQTQHAISALKSVVSALGYVGLVNLWNGEAATGKAEASFAGGRLYLSAPQSRAAREAIKRIGGWAFHPAGQDGERPRWSVPACSAGPFFLAVAAHYPNFEGLQEAVEQAKTHQAAEAKTLSVWPAGVSLVRQGAFLRLRVPYHPLFVEELRKLPWTARKWTAEKEWEISSRCQAEVEVLLKQYFPAK